MRPGIRTSEFWLVILVALSIVFLSAFGKIDPSSAIALAAMAVIHDFLRSMLKSKAPSGQ